MFGARELRKKNEMLHQFHWGLTDEELIYDLKCNHSHDDIRYDKDWGLIIPLIQKIIRNHEDEVVNVKQNLPKEVTVTFELDLDTLLYDFEFSYVLSKDVSEVFEKVVELVQILKDNKLW